MSMAAVSLVDGAVVVVGANVVLGVKVTLGALVFVTFGASVTFGAKVTFGASVAFDQFPGATVVLGHHQPGGAAVSSIIGVSEGGTAVVVALVTLSGANVVQTGTTVVLASVAFGNDALPAA